MHQYDYHPMYSCTSSCLKYVQNVALDDLVLPTYLIFFADYVLHHVMGVLTNSMLYTPCTRNTFCVNVIQFHKIQATC